MSIQSFQDLNVWKKAHSLTLKIYTVTRRYPTFEIYGLVSQLRRSAVSVCANIAEGQKKPTKDFVRFLQIAHGSLEETKYHLILSHDLKYLPTNDYESLYKIADEVGRMLNGLRVKLN
ncbi:MAG: four helix bundle protein [Candidatus Omnitrophota bacterium]